MVCVLNMLHSGVKFLPQFCSLVVFTLILIDARASMPTNETLHGQRDILSNDWNAMLSTQHPRLPTFNCPQILRSPTRPTDASRIRFADIDVIASLGDSVTAAFAAEERFILDGLREFRGLSWVSGGDPVSDGGVPVMSIARFLLNVTTVMPKGASHGSELPLDAKRDKDYVMTHFGNPKVAHLNVAQSTAVDYDMPYQADHLIQQMRVIDQVDMADDWKLINIFIGANNACTNCHQRKSDAQQYYRDQLNETLTRLHDNVPKCFVNLVNLFNISMVHDLQIKSRYCRDLQRKVQECDCMQGNDEDRLFIDYAVVWYNNAMIDLAAEWEGFNYTDFKVVVQPAMRDLKPLARDYLSGVDCFHPSRFFHAEMAVALWNNMQQPVGSKATSFTPGQSVSLCPGEDTFLQ